jgi:hypothetical protein
MIEEDYVSFETAKLLKEKGFDVYGDGSFGSETKVWMEYSPTGKINDVSTSRPHPKAYPAPTLQMAMKWLRELSFEVVVQSETDYYEDERGTKYYQTPVWYFTVYRIYDSSRMSDDERYFATFEGACEAGIKWCLENLV